MNTVPNTVTDEERFFWYAQLQAQARVYDVMFMLLLKTAPDAAEIVRDAHDQGLIMFGLLGEPDIADAAEEHTAPDPSGSS